MIRKKKNAGIKQVAERAGVSTSTVSHVINGTRFVGEEKRRRVVEVIAELDYRPNLLAQGLKGKCSKTIGLVIANLQGSFFHALVNTTGKILHSRGYDVLVCDSEEDIDTEKRHIDTLSRRGIDGLIYSSVGRHHCHPDLLDSPFPFVQIMQKNQAYQADFVGIDSSAEVQKITSRLVEQGNRRIAFLRIGKRMYSGVLYNGFREVCREHGIFTESLIENVRPENPETVEQLQSWWRRNSPIDAVFCTSADICRTLLFAFENLDRQFFDGTVVFCFEEDSWMPLLKYPVSTLRRPIEQMGETAAELLVRRMQGDKMAFESRLLECDIIGG